MNIKNILITGLANSLIGWTTLHAQTPAETQPTSTASASLTDFERSLIGTWYFGGDASQTCYIARVNNLIFTITQDRRAARIQCNPGGYLLADDYECGLRAEISQDKLLWSNGTWWSRRPSAAGSMGSNQQPLAVTGMSRDTILQELPGKTWYWHWETENRDLPTRFLVTKDDQILRLKLEGQESKVDQEWKLELRWVLSEGDHLLIPVDERRLRGFFIPTGRQVGLFSDKPQ